jgi:hypothetical protein
MVSIGENNAVQPVIELLINTVANNSHGRDIFAVDLVVRVTIPSDSI